jgi:hypothetical protein
VFLGFFKKALFYTRASIKTRVLFYTRTSINAEFHLAVGYTRTSIKAEFGFTEDYTRTSIKLQGGFYTRTSIKTGVFLKVEKVGAGLQV